MAHAFNHSIAENGAAYPSGEQVYYLHTSIMDLDMQVQSTSLGSDLILRARLLAPYLSHFASLKTVLSPCKNDPSAGMDTR